MGSVLRYLERNAPDKKGAQRSTDETVSVHSAQQTLARLEECEDAFRRQMKAGEFNTLMQQKRQLERLSVLKGDLPESEMQLRTFLDVAGVKLFCCSCVLALVFPKYSLHVMASTLLIPFFIRFAKWVSLRREHHAEIYPLRTLVGALFIPGWFKRNSY